MKINLTPLTTASIIAAATAALAAPVLSASGGDSITLNTAALQQRAQLAFSSIENLERRSDTPEATVELAARQPTSFGELTGIVLPPKNVIAESKVIADSPFDGLYPGFKGYNDDEMHPLLSEKPLRSAPVSIENKDKRWGLLREALKRPNFIAHVENGKPALKTMKQLRSFHVRTPDGSRLETWAGIGVYKQNAFRNEASAILGEPNTEGKVLYVDNGAVPMIWPNRNVEEMAEMMFYKHKFSWKTPLTKQSSNRA